MTGADPYVRLARARTLADVLVEDRDLRPPVNVEALLLEHVQVRRVAMDARYNVDAIIQGLRDVGDPIVALNDRRPLPRIRFTIGHELGHVLLAWHVGTLLCTPDEDVIEQGLDSAVAANEHEADAFAARLLLPKRFVDAQPLDDIPALLTAAETADMSLPATIRSLAALLPQGHVFAVMNPSGSLVISHHRSPRTASVGLARQHRFDRGHLQQVVGDEGVIELRDRYVWWGKTNRTIAVGEGTQDWKGVFTRILRDAGRDPRPAGKDWQSIVAVAGHARGTVVGGTVEEIAAAVDLGFRKKSDLHRVWSHPEFDEFVRARSRAFAATPTRRAKRSR